jgi:hypothetical protein
MGRWGIFKWPQMGDFGWPPGTFLEIIRKVLGDYRNPRIEHHLEKK